MRVNEHVVNVGVSVVAIGAGALIDPWFLGSLNENDVQGYAGTPVNVNGLTFEYQFDNEAAAVDFPHEGRYFVSVDSRADPYTDQLAARASTCCTRGRTTSRRRASRS